MNSRIPQVLVLDTCVLISNVLRRGLLQLARQGCFEPAWSRIIGDEWRRNAARLWSVSQDEVDAQWRSLQQGFPAADCGEIEDYKKGLQRSDPKDWHVIAAARSMQAARPQASVGIVTRNIRDFNRSELHGLDLTLLDPDQLLLRCWEAYPQCMLELLEALPAYAQAPGRPVEAVSVILKRERLFRLNKVCPCNP
ncbi:PIN domain-containing protein [Pollutimonas harenae]|uniref:PIN domain-containing protein n=1 Tax=Pollutimonas harenae TaxID=657015 RepID=A0A853H2U2_9BURK|nr:PIN domain-containing protein [Pollutimonas harenae]NYT85545.1 PIN domain-containing protein [Pollutimonas harenae]TEA70631.1 PIN domain-containing protein [Pollutimonas harenae]